MNDNKLTFINEDGQEVLCTVLFTFNSEEFGKDYVIFYEDFEDDSEDGEIELMAASYTLKEDGTIGELNEIENDDEWALIEDVLEQFDEECNCEECHHEDCDDDCECGCGCHHDHH